MKVFLLSKDDIEMSKTEVLSLYNPVEYELVSNLLFFNTDKDYTNRLAFTKSVYELLSDNLENIEEKIDWKNIISGSFKVVSTKLIEKKFASLIWNSIDSPVVDLKNPNTVIEILNEKYVCRLIKSIPTSWRMRRPHLKPEMSPTSLNPRVAICMINMASIPSGVLCDPFCGTGGIMVEAGLLGHKTIGFDIDEVTLRKARINLEHYGIKDYELVKDDALNNKKEFDFVVSDLPYGKNTKISSSLDKLYKEFFETYYDLCNTMVIGLPDFIQPDLGKWKIEKEFTLYLHKNLSKKILILKTQQ